MSHILAQGLDYFLGNKGYGAQIKEEIEEQRLESARKVLQGQRPQAELEKHKKNKKLVLMRRSWSPPANTPIIGLVYICHGYTEHMVRHGLLFHLSMLMLVETHSKLSGQLQRIGRVPL